MLVRSNIIGGGWGGGGGGGGGGGQLEGEERDRGINGKVSRGCVEKCFVGLAFFVAVRLSRYRRRSNYASALILRQNSKSQTDNFQ